MNDEGFREIQLNGKQLVFLFMAATVVSVVIFLCGVLVGRGVRGAGSAAEMAVADVGPDPVNMTMSEDPPPPAAPTLAEAAPPVEDLSYAERLLRDVPPRESLKEAPSPSPAAPPPPPQTAVAPESAKVTRAPAPAPPPPNAPEPPSTASPAAASVAASDPTGPGFAVQVAAYRDRREAETLAKQLVAKGYPAFVMDPVKGAPTAMFRVRVGKYKTLKDAEAVSTHLQRAEQFKPWIAR